MLSILKKHFIFNILCKQSLCLQQAKFILQSKSRIQLTNKPNGNKMNLIKHRVSLVQLIFVNILLNITNQYKNQKGAKSQILQFGKFQRNYNIFSISLLIKIKEQNLRQWSNKQIIGSAFELDRFFFRKHDQYLSLFDFICMKSFLNHKITDCFYKWRNKFSKNMSTLKIDCCLLRAIQQKINSSNINFFNLGKCMICKLQSSIIKLPIRERVYNSGKQALDNEKIRVMRLKLKCKSLRTGALRYLIDQSETISL